MSSATIKVSRSRADSSPRSNELGALSATTSQRGRAVIISVAGEVDASNERDWRYLLAEMVAIAAVPGRVVVDVRDLDFMGCCAYAALAREAERCRRRGVTLCLVSQDPIVARIVAACGLRWLLPIYPTTEAALGIKEE
ncbi:anti-sigma factor antagonist [Mycobacterium kyorinense]|uniref:anti-sigma factor antagonist n=1 Tax=Mycobacterium kyorinense TaxID=487514 RepID=UPI0009E01174